MRHNFLFLCFFCFGIFAKATEINLNNKYCFYNNAFIDPTIVAFGPTSICAEDSTLLSLQNVGTDIVSYNWSLNGIAISGANKLQYNASQVGNYSVVSTKSNGSTIISNSITISLAASAIIPSISALGTTSFCNGLSVDLQSSITTNIQWQKDNINISNASIGLYTATVGGDYRVKYSPSGVCPSYSNRLTVTVLNVNGLTITEGAHANPICIGNSFILSANNSLVQWTKDGVAIANNSSSVLNVTENGTYRASSNNNINSCNSLSNEIVITSFLPKQPVPIISVFGGNAICTGSFATLISNIVPSSNQIINLQWLLNGVPISGATGVGFNATSPGIYTTYITTNNLYCDNPGTISNAINISLINAGTAPVVVATSATTICSGNSVILNSDSANVQWQYNGVNINGAIGSSYSANQTGLYRAVLLNNTICTVASNSIQVTVGTANATPIISAVDNKLNICGNGNTILTSTIAGIQWQRDGIDIVGATSTALFATIGGVYRAYIPSLSACGFNYSNVLVVNVALVPVIPIVTAGGTTSFCFGGNVTLTSSVTGIQWFKDTTLVSSTTTNTLIVSESGNYTAVNTSNGCKSTSTPIVVTVLNQNSIPSISIAGGSLSICSNANVILSSSINNVQWQRDGIDIVGAIYQSYMATISGFYTAYIIGSNACGTPFSNVLAVTVLPAPATPILTASGATSFCSGGNVTLTSSISGVQWIKDSANIGNTTTNTLVVNATGLYRASISNGGCTASSLPIQITVVNPNQKPVITALSSTTICTGSAVILTSDLVGNQWQKDGVDIVGANGTVFSASSAGAYRAYQTSTSACGINFSNTINISIVAAPTAPVISSTGPISVCAPNTVTLASSSTNLQWVKDNIDIPSATGQSLIATSSGVYSAYVNVTGCKISSNNVTVSIATAGATPVISSTNGTVVCTGSGINLTSTVANVQWQFNGTNITGANGQNYTALSAGSYTAIVINGVCSAVSNVIVATASSATIAPTISATGALAFCEGGSVTLVSSLTTGNQWQKDGVNISGATNQIYNATQAGKYKVLIASSTSCAVVSTEVVVVVNTGINNPSISASGSTTTCNSAGVLLTASTAGVTWQRDFNTIAANVQTFAATVSGSYRAVVFGGNCPSYSNAIVVSVNAVIGTPTIANTGVTNFCDGGSTTLVSNFSSGNQWLKDGVNISGSIGQTFIATQSGIYKVGVTNGVCTNYSNEIQVSVNNGNNPPSISANGSTNICDGSTILLTSSQANVVWQKDLVTIATNVQTLAATQSGVYRAVVFGGVCPSYSNPITVIVTASNGIPIISPTSSTSFCDGGSVTLVSSIANVQWYLNNSLVATGQTYTATKAGNYKAISFGTNSCNGVSNSIPVSITNAGAAFTPVISANSSLNICNGNSVTLTSSIANVTWLKDGLPLTSGTNNAILVATEGGSYRAVFYGTTCPAFSNILVVVQNPQPLTPSISISAQNICDTSGITFTSSVNVIGMVWQRNMVNIDGANTATFIAKQSGTYRLVINTPGLCASISNSISVTVTLALKPVIVWDGSSFRTFTNYTSYQWLLDGLPIFGANTFTFKPTRVGNYTVRVTTIPTCTLMSDVFSLVVTANTNLSLQDNIAIKNYPNPASNWVYVELAKTPTKPVNISILNTTGMLLKSIITMQKITLVNTSTLANGIYFIAVINNKEKQVLKLIINR